MYRCGKKFLLITIFSTHRLLTLAHINVNFKLGFIMLYNILHTNICSSINKLNDFMYYIHNLDTTLDYIGVK